MLNELTQTSSPIRANTKGHNMRLLLVEDDRLLAEGLANQLEKSGFSVDITHSRIGSISALFPDFQRYPEPYQAGTGPLPKSPARRIPSDS